MERVSVFSYMKSGVPQGSFLGPTLFLLCINDLPLYMNYCYSDFFADDATLYTHDNKPNEVEEKLQCGADKYNKAVFTYKAMNNLTPKYITDLLKPVEETHNHTL